MNRKLLIWMTGLILIVATLSGCRGKGNKAVPVGDQSTPIPLPADQKATVTGYVFSTPDNKAYPKAPVWLAEVYRQGGNGVYVLDHAFSPGVYADDQGVFVISDVDPKEYVIVVGNPEGNYVVIPDDTGHARVWNVEAGKILDVGKLDVSLSATTP
jgi:predicted small lipoprotein YifL